jgi:hypothetical protein
MRRALFFTLREKPISIPAFFECFFVLMTSSY